MEKLLLKFITSLNLPKSEYKRVSGLLVLQNHCPYVVAISDKYMMLAAI